MRLLAPIFSLFSIFAAFSASAAQVLHCDYCTDSMMKSKAISAVPDGGKAYVVDVQTAKVRAYQVFRENDMVIIQPSMVSDTFEDVVKEFKTTANLFEDIAMRGIEFEHIKPYLGPYSSLINNSYDVAKTSRYRLEVTKAISKYVGDTVAGKLATAVGALGLSFVNATASVHVAFQLKFPDGSTYKFHFKGVEIVLDDTTPVLVVVPVNESGMDGDIVIPDGGKFAGYAQSAESMESLAELLEYMRQSGVNIVSSGTGNGGNPVVIICDDFTNCTAMPK